MPATYRGKGVCWFVVLQAILTCLEPLSADENTADLVLRGGKVVTMSDGLPEAEAVAIQGDRILAVGNNRVIGELVGDATRVIELKGRMVMPGLIEGHGHFTSLGESKMVLDLSRAETWEQIVDQVAAATETIPAGQWIVGRGWHQGKWTTPPPSNVEGYPVHQELSRRTPQHPVILTHGTGHMLFANAEAMRLGGVNAATTEVPGGSILRDQRGNPTGAFRENAMSLIRRPYGQSLRRRSFSEVRQYTLETIRLATEECLENGITSFQDAGSSLAEVDLFQELAEGGRLGVRLWVMLDGPNDQLAGALASYRMIGVGDHFLTVRAIKRMFDGALGTHGAWLLAPYYDLAGASGHNTLSVNSLHRTGQLAQQHGFQLCVHAIGDRANREVLDLFEHSFQVAGQDLRWRIEHAQHLDVADIPRFGQLGVIASMQGVHCTSDAPFVVQRLGERRARTGAYAWRSLLDSGAVVTNGSDAPVEDIDPFASIYSSVTRRLSNGVEFFPEQRMTRMEALRSYTRDAAFAAFEEDVKGQLAPGFLADMIVLNHDLLTVDAEQIPKTKVEYTIVGGTIRHGVVGPSRE